MSVQQGLRLVLRQTGLAGKERKKQAARQVPGHGKRCIKGAACTAVWRGQFPQLGQDFGREGVRRAFRLGYVRPEEFFRSAEKLGGNGLDGCKVAKPGCIFPR